MLEFTAITSKNDSTISSIIITDESIKSFIKKLSSHIDDYFTSVNPQSPLVSIQSQIKDVTQIHMIKCFYNHNLIKFFGKQNVLMIPSFKDSSYSEYKKPLGDKTFYYDNISIHLYPIINKHFGLNTDVTVAYPSSHTSLYKYLMEQFGITIIESNKMYRLGDEDYTIQNPEGNLFDFVLLTGCESSSDSYFNGQDVKQDFAVYCKSDFLMYDDYVNNERKCNTLMSDTTFTEYDTDDRIRGDRAEGLSEFNSWIVSNIMPKDMIVTEQESAMLQRAREEGNKLLKVY